MIKKRLLLAITVLVCLCGVSCETRRQPCLTPIEVSTNLGAYQSVETDTGNAIVDSFLPNVIIGVPDSPRFFVYAQKKVKKFRISMATFKDSTQVFIIPDSAKNTAFDVDTLTFYYERKLHFISTACGYNYNFSLLRVITTNNNIDSVRINNSNVTGDVNVEHVKIYF